MCLESFSSSSVSSTLLVSFQSTEITLQLLLLLVISIQHTVIVIVMRYNNLPFLDMFAFATLVVQQYVYVTKNNRNEELLT